METPEDIERRQSELFEQLSKSQRGLVLVKTSIEWMLSTNDGFVMASTLAEAIVKAQHRGLI